MVGVRLTKQEALYSLTKCIKGDPSLSSRVQRLHQQVHLLWEDQAVHHKSVQVAKSKSLQIPQHAPSTRHVTLRGFQPDDTRGPTTRVNPPEATSGGRGHAHLHECARRQHATPMPFTGGRRLCLPAGWC